MSTSKRQRALDAQDNPTPEALELRYAQDAYEVQLQEERQAWVAQQIAARLLARQQQEILSLSDKVTVYATGYRDRVNDVRRADFQYPDAAVMPPSNILTFYADNRLLLAVASHFTIIQGAPCTGLQISWQPFVDTLYGGRMDTLFEVGELTFILARMFGNVSAYDTVTTKMWQHNPTIGWVPRTAKWYDATWPII